MRNRVGLRKTDWYRVRFQHPERGLTFGIADMHCDEARDVGRQGRVIVAHAILPIRPFVVAEGELTECPLAVGGQGKRLADLGIWRWGIDPFDDYVALERLAHEIRAERNPAGRKVQVHDLFAIGVGDGSAHYVVTEVRGKNCRVEWRGFCPDRYIDHYFGWGRTAAMTDVARYTGRLAGLRSIFDKHSVDKLRRFDELVADYETTHGFAPNVRS